MLGPEKFASEMSAPENANTGTSLTVAVSVDENLLALLHNQPSFQTEIETKKKVKNTQENPDIGPVRSSSAAPTCASAAFASLGRPPLVPARETFQPQPLGAHIVGPVVANGSGSFGVIPTTSRRIFGQSNPAPEQMAATAPRSLLKLTAPAASAAIAASLEPAIHLPVSHLSSSFGAHWNGAERRKVPRETSFPNTQSQITLAPEISSRKVLSLDSSPLTDSPTQEAAPAESDYSAPLAKPMNQSAAAKAAVAWEGETPASTTSPAAVTVFGAQSDPSPGLVLYQAPRPNRLPLLLLFGATAATLAGLAFLFGFTPAGQARPPVGSTAASPLQLKVESKDHAFIGIRWNPDCLPILNAETGRLIVLESDQAPRLIDLQPAQLKIGHIYYQTNFDRVEFRMEVEDAAGAVTKESFLALLPGRSGTASAATGGLSVVSPGAPVEAIEALPASSKNFIAPHSTPKPGMKPGTAKPTTAAPVEPPPLAWQISPAPSQRGAPSLALVHPRSNSK
jgi:hypothetical protein